MTTFAQVAHLYLGCRVTRKGDDTKDSNILMGLTHMFGEMHGLFAPKCNEGLPIDKLVPILRPISSLMDVEKKYFWSIIFKRPFPDSGAILWFDKETTLTCKRWVMQSGVDRLGIQMNCDIWADCDLSPLKMNPHLNTLYLLSIHIDLFGLIESGQAVEAV